MGNKVELVATESLLLRGEDGIGRSKIQPAGKPFIATEDYAKALMKTDGLGVRKYAKPGPKQKAEKKPNPAVEE